jgi:hypothetical protein
MLQAEEPGGHSILLAVKLDVLKIQSCDTCMLLEWNGIVACSWNGMELLHVGEFE